MQNTQQIINANININININTKGDYYYFCLLDANSCKILSLFLLIKEYTTIHRWGNTLQERNKINTRKRQQNTMKHMMVNDGHCIMRLRLLHLWLAKCPYVSPLGYGISLITVTILVALWLRLASERQHDRNRITCKVALDSRSLLCLVCNVRQ